MKNTSLYRKCRQTSNWKTLLLKMYKSMQGKSFKAWAFGPSWKDAFLSLRDLLYSASHTSISQWGPWYFICSRIICRASQNAVFLLADPQDVWQKGQVICIFLESPRNHYLWSSLEPLADIRPAWTTISSHRGEFHVCQSTAISIDLSQFSKLTCVVT